jgi:hypothetical protein
MPDATSTIAAIKQKYPDYASVPDEKLAAAVYAKYPDAYPQLKGFKAAPPPRVPKPGETIMRAATPADTSGGDVSRKRIEKFKSDFFRSDDPGANIPNAVRIALQKNPKDAVVLEHLRQMNPISQTAILEEARRVRHERMGISDPDDPLNTYAHPKTAGQVIANYAKEPFDPRTIAMVATPFGAPGEFGAVLGSKIGRAGMGLLAAHQGVQTAQQVRSDVQAGQYGAAVAHGVVGGGLTALGGLGAAHGVPMANPAEEEAAALFAENLARRRALAEQRRVARGTSPEVSKAAAKGAREVGEMAVSRSGKRPASKVEPEVEAIRRIGAKQEVERGRALIAAKEQPQLQTARPPKPKGGTKPTPGGPEITPEPSFQDFLEGIGAGEAVLPPTGEEPADFLGTTGEAPIKIEKAFRPPKTKGKGPSQAELQQQYDARQTEANQQRAFAEGERKNIPVPSSARFRIFSKDGNSVAAETDSPELATAALVQGHKVTDTARATGPARSIKEVQDALRIGGSEEILQRQPEEAGGAGSGRGRVEPGEQGQTPAGAQPEGEARGVEGPGASNANAEAPHRIAAEDIMGRDGYGSDLKADTAAARSHIKSLKSLGYEMDDVEQALAEHAEIRRADYERGEDGQDAYESDKMDAWTVVQDAFDSLEAPEKPVGKLEQAANAARKRIKGKLNRLSAGLDPTILSDAAIIGAHHIAKGATTFAEFSKRMEAEHPEARPFMKQIYQASLARHAGMQGLPAPPEALPTGNQTEKDPHIEAVKAKLDEAQKKAGAVKRGYAPQRGKKFVQFRQGLKTAGGTEAGFERAMSSLHGELEQPAFEPLDLPQETRDALYQRIADSNLGTGNILTARGGLKKILDTEHPRIPAPHEVKQLRKIFGDEFVDKVTGNAANTWGRRIADILQIPRSLMETGNLHATLRQALPLSVANPKAGFIAMAKGLRAMVPGEYAKRVNVAIHESPNMPLYDESGLHLSGPRLSEREEDFQSSLAERIPLLGPFVKASQRAYSTQLNVLRTKVFDDFVKSAETQGITPETHPHEFKALATYINKMSGWGEFGKADDLAPYLNAVIYSPRLQASRLQLMGDLATGFRKYPPAVRKLAARDFAANASFYLGLLTFSKMMGAKVGTDPDSPDFGKIVVGNTHVDVSGGFGSLLRPFVRFAAEEQKMHSGKSIGRKEPTAVIGQAAAAKMAPIPSFAYDVARGHDQAGKNLKGAKNIGKAAEVRFAPIFGHEVLEAMKETGGPAGVGLGVAGFFGAGETSYKPK